jgi:cytochrome c oxidase subunit 1
MGGQSRDLALTGAGRRSFLYRLCLSTDHKDVGLAYVLTAGAFTFLAFGLILILRWQLAYPGEPIPIFSAFPDAFTQWMPGGILLPNAYNQLGAMHGTMMVFLAVVPLAVGGFGTYLVPLMVGAANTPFPRLSRLGYLLYAAAGVLLLASFFTPAGPANSGWTAYPPLSVIENSGQSMWLFSVLFIGLSNLLLCVNLITTAVQLRAPGLTMMRLPFFVWSQLVAALLLLLAIPSLAAASILQLMDRLAGTSFFLPEGLVISGQALEVSGGGSPLLWQHLYWFLAHPEVYVLILPAFGIIAEIIANNTRKPLWGYSAMVIAALFLGVMSMLVWAHHMYLTGMGALLTAFFQVTTVIISVPSIILATALVISLWGGSIRFTLPMLWSLAFLPMFGIGGLTGLPLALSATNIHLHDTNYVIGHFHLIVGPGTLFALFAGIYYWFPKVTGRMMNTRLGHLHFWPTFVFMFLVFTPMLLQGMYGVSRRLYDGGLTYSHGQEVFFLHKVSTHAALSLALVQIPFLINFLWSIFRGRPAVENPWQATTLEWAAPSPPLAQGNFAHEPSVYRGPYEYSLPGAERDFSPQHEPEVRR